MQHFRLQGRSEQDVRVGINRERLEHARKTPKHTLPQGMSLDEMRNHILAVAEKSKQQ